MQPCWAWLLSCSVSSSSHNNIRPRDVRRGIAAPVRIYEAESQEQRRSTPRSQTDSDPFGACCWPSAVVAARALAPRHVAGLKVLELGAGTGLASATAARLARPSSRRACPTALELLLRAAADGGLSTFVGLISPMPTPLRLLDTSTSSSLRIPCTRKPSLGRTAIA